MDILKTLKLMVLLFLADCLFCWLMTAQWLSAPFLIIVSFIGGIALISTLGIFVIHHD